MGVIDKFETYYNILGVSPTASTEEISKAYRKLSLKAHPDKGGSPAAFRRLKKAHEVLQDPDKRILYDKYGASLAPSPGDLIGSGTVGRLVPLLTCAAGGAAFQCLRAVGACSINGWVLGCLLTAGGSWANARASRGRGRAAGGGGGDGALPAICGGMLVGNLVGLALGTTAFWGSRWLRRK